MGLKSIALKGDAALEACLISDPAHIVPGATGPHVSKIQAAITKLDSLVIDAAEIANQRYGPSTAAAVLKFKQKRNIVNRSYQTVADNITGKMTIAALDHELSLLDPPGPNPRELGPGSRGKDVESLQRLLNRHLAGRGIPLTPDGVFGPKTEARVKEFQTLNRNYLLAMPIHNASVPREPLMPTGVVNNSTLAALLDFRIITTDDSRFHLTDGRSASSANRLAQSVANTAVGDPPNPPTTLRIVTFQSGQQVSVNPWDFSPFVLTAQYTVLAKNDGKPDFLMTAGAQVSLNSSGNNGRWSGQGFAQMGLALNLKLFRDRLDLLNPFVQAMLQHNHGATDASNTAGLAVGNQISWSLASRTVNGDRQDVLSFFLNQQVVTAVDLSNGQCAAPAGQFMAGASFSFF